MSALTTAEIEYMKDQRLDRLATVNGKGEPHVVPVGFSYNAERDVIDIGGHNMGRRKKLRDASSTGRAAFVVDDVLPPWQPRGMEVFEEGGQGVNADFGAELIRLHPGRIVGWGLDTDAYHPNGRSVEGAAV